jgi:hypothetical protein
MPYIIFFKIPQYQHVSWKEILNPITFFMLGKAFDYEIYYSWAHIYLHLA